MEKLGLFLVLAILSNGVLGISLRNKRQAEDPDDFEDEYWWNRPNHLGGGLYPQFSDQYRDQMFNQFFWQQTNPTAPPTVPTPDVNGSSTQSSSVQDCIRTCPVTSEYNPVCGSNSVTYDNPGRLVCAQACGVSVSLQRRSRCPTPTAPPTVPTPDVNGSSTQSSSVQDCIRTCPVTSEYYPVCGSNSVTYDNPGRLVCAQACGVSVSLQRRSRCPTPTAPPSVPTPDVNGSSTQSRSVQDCIRTCPVTSEYNPVCGSNSVTYDNPGRLVCAQACGVSVSLLRRSRCPPPTPPPSAWI